MKHIQVTREFAIAGSGGAVAQLQAHHLCAC